ncbi:ribosome silencing factor [Aggregatilineales bacterium SYSU G02658]
MDRATGLTHTNRASCYNAHISTHQLGDIALEPLELARLIVDTLEDKKAEDIVLLDLRPDTHLADFFVICTGNSDRQIRALVDYVRQTCKDVGKLPFNVEGTPESGWMLMDYSNVVVHIFNAEQRDYYDLQGLWSKSAQVLLSIQ